VVTGFILRVCARRGGALSDEVESWAVAGLRGVCGVW